MSESATGAKQEHAGVRLPPPLLYLAVLAAGLLLHRLAPVHPLPRVIALPLALLCLVGWLVISVWAIGYFRRARTTILPMKPTTALITGGPFRYSRNPLYVGMALLYLAVSLWVNALWPLVLFPVAVMLIQRLVIAREERYLAARFGEAYREYCGRVPRWL